MPRRRPDMGPKGKPLLPLQAVPSAPGSGAGAGPPATGMGVGVTAQGGQKGGGAKRKEEADKPKPAAKRPKTQPAKGGAGGVPGARVDFPVTAAGNGAPMTAGEAAFAAKKKKAPAKKAPAGTSAADKAQELKIAAGQIKQWVDDVDLKVDDPSVPEHIRRICLAKRVLKPAHLFRLLEAGLGNTQPPPSAVNGAGVSSANGNGAASTSRRMGIDDDCVALVCDVGRHLALNTLHQAARLAQHRGSARIEGQDCARYLRTHWNLDVRPAEGREEGPGAAPPSVPGMETAAMHTAALRGSDAARRHLMRQAEAKRMSQAAAQAPNEKKPPEK